MDSTAVQEDSVRRNIAQWLKPSLLPFLILSASFITYLDGISYPLISPEIGIALCGIGLLALAVSSVTVRQWRGWYALVVAVLIALFFDKQWGDIAHINKFGLIGSIFAVVVFALTLKEKFYLAMTAFFSAWLVSTLVLPLWAEGSGAMRFVDNGRLVGSNVPPRIIHLILDAHIGIEGMPTNTDLGKAVKEQIINFYHRYDFFVYGGAYSHYFRTWDAIPNAMNFSAEPTQNAWVTRVDHSSPFRILTNTYFRVLSQRHYNLNVVESDVLDFCSDSDTNAALQGCTTYRAHALGALARVNLPVSRKVVLVCVGYLKSSHRFLALAPMYQSLQRKFTSHEVSLLSEAEDAFWAPSSSFFGSMNTMEIVDGLWDEVLRVPPGNALVAHLLLPHYPYLYNADCSIHSSIEDWRTGTNFGEFRSLRTGQNSSQLREEQYRLYFQQLQCLYARLDTLFLSMKRAGVFDDSIIVLHGDHGSRNFRHEPTPDNVALLTEDDYIDAFSTLYAIKIPRKPGGYDSSILPLEQLLAQSLQIPQEVRSGTPETSTPFVYLPSKDGEDFVEVAFPMFARRGGQ